MLLRTVLIILGAASFWGPATLAIALTGRELSVILGTALSSSAFLLSYVAADRKLSHSNISSLWMLVGVYLLGGLFSLIAFTATGSGLSGLHGWDALIIFLVSFIPFWVMLYGSVAMGTAPGLLFVTVVTLFVNSRKKERASTPK